jgi:hypothetical protein
VNTGIVQTDDLRNACPTKRSVLSWLLLFPLLLLGCSAGQVAVVPSATTVTGGTQPPPSGAFAQLGAVTATHGGGCGLYGSRGTYEGAFTILRNKATALGADYVQIVRVSEPRLEGVCMRQSYIIDGIAYRRVAGAASPPPPSAAMSTTARAPGLNGTYSGDITGNTQGRVFTARITFTIVQQADQVVGTFTTNVGTTGTIKGVVTENGIREMTARQLQPCIGDYGGVAVIEADGSRLTGSYVGSDCGGSLTASFNMIRQP